MPDKRIEEIKRDLAADLKLLTAIPRDQDEPMDMVHDIVAPHALRRAIAAEKLVEQQQAEIHHRDVTISVLLGNLDMYVKENERLTENRRLRRMQSVEEYYTILCKLRDSQAEVERLRELYEREREIADRLKNGALKLEAKLGEDRDRWKEEALLQARLYTEKNELLEQFQEENELLKGTIANLESECDQLRGELEQVKAERDESRRSHTALFKEYRNIERERDDYRMVLELIATCQPESYTDDVEAMMEAAKIALSRYKRGESQ